MNLADLNVWLDYHYWARDIVLEASERLSPEQFIAPVESSFKSVRDTLAHTYGADWIWYSRWTGQVPVSMPAYDGWPDVTSLRKAWLDLEVKVRTLVRDGGEEGVSRVYSYKLLSGQPMSSPFWQMVVHVVNHGTYHRGQLTTLLRQLGVAPPKDMDMIVFFRQRQAAV